MLVPKRKLTASVKSQLPCRNSPLFFCQKKVIAYDNTFKQLSKHDPTFQKETTY